MEDIISECKDKIEIKEKETEEILVKQLKSCERNMEELSDSIKRPNLITPEAPAHPCLLRHYSQ
jgi:hypothetical protein